MKTTVLILVALFALTTQAQDQRPQVPQISVTGEGKVKITPDQVVINVGFQNTGKDAKEVKNLNDEIGRAHV